MVAAVIGQAMEKLDLAFPEVKGEAVTELEKVRAALGEGE
jgi:hypothetical protein